MYRGMRARGLQIKRNRELWYMEGDRVASYAALNRSMKGSQLCSMTFDGTGEATELEQSHNAWRRLGSARARPFMPVG